MSNDQTEGRGNPEQEIWLVLDGKGGPIFCAGWPQACHEHINNAINEHGIEGAEKWTVRRAELAPGIPHQNGQLAVCPCGRVPTALGIYDNNQGGKWASVSGNCCGDWSVEFRTNYFALDSEKCMALAVEAWNEAPRAAGLL